MSPEKLPKIIVIAGPTASGKSDLALNLASSFEGELICTDSMQVYRRMDIGTAKPTREEQAQIKHYQIDLVDPDGHYSAGQFERDSEKIIKDIVSRSQIPFLVGGTGLYFRSLMYGISDIPDIPDEIREQVTEWQTQMGTAFCWQKLKELSPEESCRYHENDTARILRSLEVILATGTPLGDFQKQKPFSEPKYPFKMIVLNWDRELLYQRINLRTELMLKQGWIEEVEALLKDFSPKIKSLQSIGYREIVEFLQGNITRDEMLGQIQQRTRRYAKRQLTWFRKEKNVTWVNPKNIDSIVEMIQVFLRPDNGF